MGQDSKVIKAMDATDDLNRQVQDLTEPLRLEYFRRWDQFRAGLTQIQGAQARIALAKQRQEFNEKERLKAGKWGVGILIALLALRWFKDGSIDPSTSDLFLFVIGYAIYFYLTFVVRERDQFRLEEALADKNRLEFNVEAAGVDSTYLNELYRYWERRQLDNEAYSYDDEKFDGIDIFNRIQRVILNRVTE